MPGGRIGSRCPAAHRWIRGDVGLRGRVARIRSDAVAAVVSEGVGDEVGASVDCGARKVGVAKNARVHHGNVDRAGTRGRVPRSRQVGTAHGGWVARLRYPAGGNDVRDGGILGHQVPLKAKARGGRRERGAQDAIRRDVFELTGRGHALRHCLGVLQRHGGGQRDHMGIARHGALVRHGQLSSGRPALYGRNVDAHRAPVCVCGLQLERAIRAAFSLTINCDTHCV